LMMVLGVQALYAEKGEKGKALQAKKAAGASDVLKKGEAFLAANAKKEGVKAISMVRQMMGKTDPQEAASGTIRGDYSQFIGKNIVHGSDSRETAEFEINLWFNEKELCNYSRIDEAWLTE